jgi:hypothetical protein
MTENAEVPICIIENVGLVSVVRLEIPEHLKDDRDLASFAMSVIEQIVPGHQQYPHLLVLQPIIIGGVDIVWKFLPVNGGPLIRLSGKEGMN